MINKIRIKNNKVFPNKKYNIIYADPPWTYNDKNCNGNCNIKYNTMNVNDICNLNIQSITEKDCILFIWITYPMIQEGLKVIQSWGFKYKSIGFQWVKYNKKNGKPFFGLGRWTRGNTEACFIATIGKPQRQNNGIFQLIQTPIETHSKKPDIVRDKIVELIGDLPRIELFARKKVIGWDSWGNEI